MPYRKITAPAGLATPDGEHGGNLTHVDLTDGRTDPGAGRVWFLNGVAYTDQRIDWFQRKGYTVEDIDDGDIPEAYTAYVLHRSVHLEPQNTSPIVDAAAPAPTTRSYGYTLTPPTDGDVPPTWIPASANPNA